MRTCLTLAVMVVLLPAVDEDHQSIEGTWVVVAGEVGGEPMSRPEEAVILLVITRDTITFETPPDLKPTDREVKYARDLARKPGAIDLTTKAGTLKGIYQIQGDTL